MRRLLIRVSFAALARVAGIEPASFGFGGRRSTSLNFTLFSKINKNNRPGSGAHSTYALRPSRHDSPNDPLAGHFDYVAFEGPKHHVNSPSGCLRNCRTICGASGRPRTCVHFVRSEGHQSPLARTLKSLVGELRIELRPRAPKARMQRITLFPVVPAQRVERCSLRFQRSVSTAHTRLAKSGGPCGN